MPKRSYQQRLYDEAEARERRQQARRAAYRAAQRRANESVYDIVLANQGRNSFMYYQPHRQQWRYRQRQEALRANELRFEQHMRDVDQFVMHPHDEY